MKKSITQEGPTRRTLLKGATAGVAAYAFAAARLGATLTPEPGFAQLAFYAVAGVAWVWPAAKLVRWMRRDDR